MPTKSLRPALLLAVWTVLVWTTRIRNIWTDEALSTNGQIWRTALAGVFTVFAIGTVVLWRRRADAAGWVRAFAVWTVGVWAIRAVQIGLADHGAAFKIVHTVLAVVSTCLALWADREANASTPRSEPATI
ncbi:hypothetical protein [Actinospongicola halichondriae]|uniref:hypothetical protein n=1 Tax=Actinospongicola halichondriae TaxID=3236844 RepID=UPI003D4D80D1